MTYQVVKTSVLIVGGGPAGLTASLLLSRHGVDSLLIDKRLTGSPLPRARGVHSRAMEILRVCGIEPDLRAVELPITPGAEWRTDLTSPPLREDVPSAGRSAVSPCEGLSVSQDVFESVLRDHVRSCVRQQLGIAMNGPDELGQQTMIAFRADLTSQTGDRPRGIYFLTATATALIWTHADD